MQTRSIFTAIVISTTGILAVAAQPKDTFAKDREAILGMVGSFDVTFTFEESFPIQKGYELRKPYQEEARELVKVISDTGERIVLQHLLTFGPEDDQKVIKHWGQIWTYQDSKILNYEGDVHWTNKDLTEEDAAGTWAQLVTQTDDTPRYESEGKWTHSEGASEWVSATTRRPLPRREYTTRDDYDVLIVQNRHIVTPQGWSHFQYNLKRNESGDVPFDLCMEVGLNIYTKLPMGTLAAADKWWEENETFWKPVNETWTVAFDEAQSINLNPEKETKSFARQFKELVRAGEKKGSEAPAAFPEFIEKFVAK